MPSWLYPAEQEAGWVVLNKGIRAGLAKREDGWLDCSSVEKSKKPKGKESFEPGTIGLRVLFGSSYVDEEIMVEEPPALCITGLEAI